MRKVCQLLCGALLAAGLWALAATPALATYTHVFSSSFGEAGSGDGQMELRGVREEGAEAGGGSGVAVNSSTHDVYVADTGNHRVDEFSASGAFIRAWGWGVADGTTEALQTCTSGCHAGLPGAGAGQLTEPSFIAVDNSGDPSQGDVYVADRASGAAAAVIVRFSASGGYLSTNDGSGAIFPFSGPFGKVIGGIAVDASGNLWVYAEDKGGLTRNAVDDIFEFAQDGSFITDRGATGVGMTGIAIDPEGNLYVSQGTYRKYTPAGALVGDVSNTYLFGAAVNAVTNSLYVDEGSPGGQGEQIVRYDTCEPVDGFCAPVERFGSGELSHAGELAVDASNDTVYASDIGDGRIAVFGRTPDVTTGAPVSRAATVAVMSGTVNPTTPLSATVTSTTSPTPRTPRVNQIPIPRVGPSPATPHPRARGPSPSTPKYRA